MSSIREHPEQQLEEYIALFLTKLVRIIQIVIPLMAKFSKDHPNVFLVFASALVIYVTWRILCNMVVIVKRLAFVSLLLFASFVFLRGFNQVFFEDIPLLYKIVTGNQNFEVMLTKWTAYLGSTSFDHFVKVLQELNSRAQQLAQSVRQKAASSNLL